MSKSVLILVFAGILAVCIAGCQVQPGGITSSTIPLNDDNYTVIQKDVVGKVWNIGILCFPLWPISAYDALQKAKVDNGADGLINVSANDVIILWGCYHQIEIRGDAIKVKKGN